MTLNRRSQVSDCGGLDDPLLPYGPGPLMVDSSIAEAKCVVERPRRWDHILDIAPFVSFETHVCVCALNLITQYVYHLETIFRVRMS